MGEIVRVDGVTKKFGGFVALNRVSLSINEFETTSIIGPNGAGKTTLINVITGKLHPENGRIYLYGRDITGLPPSRRVMLGLNRTFQIINIFQNMTVYENILISALSQGKDNARETVDNVISRLKLSEYRDVKAFKLPHGLQRILELAIALATHPKILFLDEPTAGLNPAEKSSITSILEDLGSNISLVIVEHDMDVVFSLSKRVIVMHKGEVIADGKPQEISLDHRVKEVYLG
ncbi:MAG: ABC transporter ATP-binding protein [Candidatus Methanomethylicia archaeon]